MSRVETLNAKKTLERMKSLAWKIAEEKKGEKDVVAILLFGSVAKGSIHSESDVDLVLIKDSRKNFIKRNQSIEEKIKIDLWEHSYSFYEQLFAKNWPPEQMFLYSLFLNILQECEILYDKESKFEKYKKNALKWKWPTNCKEFIGNKIEEAINNYERGKYEKFEKLVYIRKLFLLYICERFLNAGKPVSIRNKDYYLKCKEYFSVQEFKTVFGKIPDRKKMDLLIERILQIFYDEVKNREPWTELKDAENHFLNKENFMAAISLQNGAYYLGCEGLSNRGVKMKNKGFLYPESEIELIRKANKHWKEFYDLYRKIHNVEAWDNEEIDLVLNFLLRLIKDKQVNYL